jgi:hypothetical protein
VQTGLLSVASPEGDTVGLDSLASRVTACTASSPARDVPPGAVGDHRPARQGAEARRWHRFDTIADPGAFECTNDPDGQGPDTDPYGMRITHHTIWVAGREPVTTS